MIINIRNEDGEYVYDVSKIDDEQKRNGANISISKIGTLNVLVEALNYAFVYHDVYLMPFHPEDNDDEVEFLQEESIVKQADKPFYMVLIQPYNELEEASKLLHKKGYYDEWDKDYYRDTVIKRQTYRRVYNDGKKENSKKE